MVDPRLEGYLNGVAELLRNPTPVRKAGEKPVMRRDRRGWRRFLEVETNGEMGVKNEDHGHRVTGKGCKRVAMNVFKNME
jgi:hypothetical protein